MHLKSASAVAVASLASTIAAHGYVDTLNIAGVKYTVRTTSHLPASISPKEQKKTNALYRVIRYTQTLECIPPRYARY